MSPRPRWDGASVASRRDGASVASRRDGASAASRRGGDSAASRPGRGQTTIDFAIGASLFLLTIAFVLAFVPVMFQPFSDTQEKPLIADRAANNLATDILTDPDEPYLLSTERTWAFFNESDPETHLGVSDPTRVNVTLERGGTVVQSTGDDPDGSSDVVTAKRRVQFRGESHQLYVRVW